MCKIDLQINIPVQVQYILNKLESNGYEAYIVGGCVRDSLLLIKPHDYDIATSAKPEEIIRLFKHEKTIPTGLQHGTVTVVLNEESYEITTFREDGAYSDNRHPDSVKFVTDIKSDLSRRDFTINAMAYNPKTGLIDPYGGARDLSNKTIRCVGVAKDRFSEDPLRILRAIRFSVTYGFTVELGTEYEIHRHKDKLINISKERIRDEFCKMVSSVSGSKRLLMYGDVLSVFIPELKEAIYFDQKNPYHDYDVYEHSILALNSCYVQVMILRLAIFFHDIGKPYCYQDGEDGVRHFKGHGKVSADLTNSIMKRLKFDNDTREKVVQLVFYHEATLVKNKSNIKRWLNNIGEEQFRRLCLLRICDLYGQKLDGNYNSDRINEIYDISTMINNILSEQECFSLKDLAINGNDVKVCMHINEGKEIGQWLQRILSLVIDGDLKNDKEELIRYMTGVSDGWIKP